MDHANPGFHTFWQANRERPRGRAPRGYRSRFRGRGHRHRPHRFRSQMFRKKGRQSCPTDGYLRQRQPFRRWRVHDCSRGNGQQHLPRGQENRAQLDNREPGFEGRPEPSSGPNSSMGSLWLQRSTSHPVCPPAPQHEPQYLNDTTGAWFPQALSKLNLGSDTLLQRSSQPVHHKAGEDGAIRDWTVQNNNISCCSASEALPVVAAHSAR